jgi:hypothetical protein
MYVLFCLVCGIDPRILGIIGHILVQTLQECRYFMAVKLQFKLLQYKNLNDCIILFT